MKEEDVLRYGVDKDMWKDILNKRITDIAKASKIPPESIEWIASYHRKKNNPHCHLIFWNKDQDLELNKMPFINYKQVKKAVAKEVFKEEIEKLYDTKNVSKKEISSLSKEELQKYKEKVKEELKNSDLNLNIIDTSKEEELIKSISDKLKIGEKVYIYNRKNPEEFTEIRKENQITIHKYFGNEVKEEKEILKFKNNGEHSILYKNNDFTDTACFLANFNDLAVAETKEKLEKIIKDKLDSDFEIDNELREIIPQIVPNNIFSNEFRTKSFLDITSKIAFLKEEIKKENEKAGIGNKLTFRYDLQQPKIKKDIDKISTLILNTSKDCKIQFNNYIGTSLDIARYLSDIENKYDYERVKQVAKDEMFNKMGNQILQFLKESINENYNEEYEKKKLEYERKNLEFEISREQFQKQIQERNTKNLIQDIFNTLNTNNISLQAKKNRLKSGFRDMTKEQMREILKMKENSNGFEWFD